MRDSIESITSPQPAVTTFAFPSVLFFFYESMQAILEMKIRPSVSVTHTEEELDRREGKGRRCCLGVRN